MQRQLLLNCSNTSNFFLKKKCILFIGPLGYVIQQLKGTSLAVQQNALFFDTKKSLATFLAHFFQRFKGVTVGYMAHLKFKGLGFRFIQFRNRLLIRIGFTHYIEYRIPSTISIAGYRTNLYLFSINLIELNRITVFLKGLYRFNKYNEKGIFFNNQEVVLKIGKERT